MAAFNAQSVVYTALCITGSTWISEEDLKQYCQKNKLPFAQISNASGIVQYNGHFSTKKVAQEENDIAINIMGLKYMHPVKQIDLDKIERLVHRFEEDENGGRHLHFHQVDAVKMVVNNSFSVLTGGPGTGKTTVLSAIAYVLRHLEKNIEIAYTAPTGKAARRISESTGEMATTLHKKLGITKDDTNNVIPISEDVLFIDESSMNDNNLTACLSKAIKGGMRVVFVGDVDQLPSVGIGAVLRDLIASEVVPVTMLTHTFRQDNSSMLFANICKCRKGDVNFVEGPDFKPIKIRGENINREAIIQMYNHYKQAVEEFGVDQVVVLLPYRKKGVCSNYMNNVLQKLANKTTKRYRFHNKADENWLDFKEGDFVMQLENRDECANGDVGKVIMVSPSGVKVQYVDGEVEYAPDELEQLALAYSMSIHKSQGSEYACVIMCLLNAHKSMLNRNLVYTGITRAKKKCIFMYEEDALKKALNTIAEASRKTFLVEKLRVLDKKYKICM